MTPHKHADIIKAWADGARIQAKASTEWHDVECPNWYRNVEYRVSPFIVRYLRLYISKLGGIDYISRLDPATADLPHTFKSWVGDWVPVLYNNETHEYVGPVKDETT